jgi:hypothetical protein
MKYMDKREFLIDYIKKCDNDKLDEIYDDLFGKSDEKTDLIIDRVRPFLVYLYFSLSEEQIREVFPKKKPVDL